MEQQKNVAYLRPVIAWSPTEEFTVSAAMEANVVKNAYGYTDNKGILSISPIVPVMVLA